jgi:hypothetical protein
VADLDGISADLCDRCLIPQGASSNDLFANTETYTQSSSDINEILGTAMSSNNGLAFCSRCTGDNKLVEINNVDD